MTPPIRPAPPREEELRPDGENSLGYFPARLGQPLEGGRFCIVRKLGWGMYANVWLAKDKRDNRFVALKILTSDATKDLQNTGDLKRSDELAMLQKISSAQSNHRGFKHNLQFYESFKFQGPHGNHLCIVTEVLGYSLDYIRNQSKDGDRRLNIPLARRLSKHILCGLEYLHTVCGIVHTDLKFDNILFRPFNVPAIVGKALVEEPSLSCNFDTKASPPALFISQPLGVTIEALSSITELQAVIADVGQSHWRDRHFQELIQPGGLRAPEVILGYPWSDSADIWNFGCLISEVLIGSWLFEYTRNGDIWGAEEDHLARMTEALGETFDPSFLAKCEHSAKFFRPDGSFAHFTVHEEPTWPLEECISKCALLTEEQSAEDAARFLRRCLRLRPEDRATARELLDDPWLAGVDDK